MKLKEPCNNCQLKYSTTQQKDCTECNGKGFILTHEGEVIKEFIEENFKAKLGYKGDYIIHGDIEMVFKP